MHVMSISEKKRDHEFRGERAGAYGRVCWRKEQAETCHQNIMAKRNKTRQRQQKIL